MYDIIQDKDGYIWMSTLGAICRYNGKNFRTFDANFLGTAESTHLNIAVDKNNNIWFAEKEHINKVQKGGVLNPTKNQVYTFDEYTNGLLTENSVLTIDHSSFNSKEWFVTTMDGVVYKYSDGFEEIFSFPDAIIGFTFCDEAPNGDYWIAHYGEIFQVGKQTATQSYKTESYLHTVKRFKPNLVFERFSNDRPYFELMDGKLSPYTFPHTQNISVNMMAYCGDNLNYLTTNQAKTLLIQDKDGNMLLEYHHTKNQSSFKNLLINKAFIDNQNITWLATANGLLKVVQKENPFTLLQANNSIRGIYQEGDYQWIGGYKNSVFPNIEKTGEGWEHLPKLPMTQFTKNDKGHLWIGTISRALVAYIPESDEQKAYYLNQNINLYCPFYNKTTDELWVGTNEGLFIFNPLKNTLKLIDLAIPTFNFEIRQIYENEAGIWLVSNKGLFLLAKKTRQVIQQYTTSNLLPHDNLNHLYEDKDGIFWLASKGGGLLKWNRQTNKLQQFRQENGLSNNVIYAVYEDDYNKLWLPSNYGLMSFDKNTANTKVYLPQNGIAHEEFNTFSHFKAADGTLYFGGINGITKFHPKDFQANQKYDVPLVLQEINVLSTNGNQFENRTEAFKKHNSVEITPTDQVVEVTLSLLDYESFEENQYAYQIEQNNYQWIYTNDNKVTFTNLPYGDYAINFKARGASGIWTTSPLTIRVLVHKPFYLQSWFFMLIGLLTISMVIIAMWWREQQLQKDKERLEQEVKKRTKEIEHSKGIILQQSEKLKALDKAKSQFFANITHEFRTPLTLVIGPLQQITKSPEKLIPVKQLTNVLKNAQSLLTLINQLLDISKLEDGKMKLEITRGNIIAYTQSLIEGFESLAHKKKQRLVFLNARHNWETHFDKGKWDKIIYNLVFNAIKFTPEHGAIQVCLRNIQESSKEWIYLKVRDSGVGIAKKQLPQIFNRFYQADGSTTRLQEGTGIGLSLVKELVELQGGRIKVISKVGGGTSFEVKLPVHSVANVLPFEKPTRTSFPILPTLSADYTLPTTKNAAALHQEKLRLLIIEDNEEMCTYIKSCVPLAYSIATAINGLEGIEKAQTLIPDLIISDVMMPLKDGFEVTQTIRANVATSHIPIILLTAKAALESRLEGLKRGADAYLTKPFSPEELSLRIQKLIEIRRLLQERYQIDHSQNLPSAKLGKSFVDEDVFITRLRKFILEHLDNPRLNGDAIGSNFRMSRMQLHRKLKALTNQSTTEFIRTIRLEMAFTLLQQKELNVSEIAYQTGFSSLSHFTKKFKEKYQITPSKLLK